MNPARNKLGFLFFIAIQPNIHSCPESLRSSGTPTTSTTPSGDIALYKQERVYAILLDGESVLGIEEISRGSGMCVEAQPERVFRPAIQRRCKSIILVHNHPSGFAYPSNEDRAVMWKLMSDGSDLGIDVADSVIVAADGYYSFKEEMERMLVKG